MNYAVGLPRIRKTLETPRSSALGLIHNVVHLLIKHLPVGLWSALYLTSAVSPNTNLLLIIMAFWHVRGKKSCEREIRVSWTWISYSTLCKHTLQFGTMYIWRLYNVYKSFVDLMIPVQKSSHLSLEKLWYERTKFWLVCALPSNEGKRSLLNTFPKRWHSWIQIWIIPALIAIQPCIWIYCITHLC